MSDYILMVQLDIDKDHADEFNELYEKEHFRIDRGAPIIQP
jgi:hypothetical protein